MQLIVTTLKMSKRVFRKGGRALYLTPLELPEKLQKLTVRRLSCHTPCLAMLRYSNYQPGVLHYQFNCPECRLPWRHAHRGEPAELTALPNQAPA